MSEVAGTVTELWRDRVLASASERAIIGAECEATFAQLEALRAEISDNLRGLRSVPGQAVTLDTAPGASTIAAVLALREHRLVAVPVSAAWPANFVEKVKLSADAVAHIDGTGAVSRSDDVTGRRTYPTDCFQIVHTSGSVGTPKGVLISEKALLHRLRWFWETDPQANAACHLIHKSPALVAAAPEYFQGLLSGQPSYVLETSRNPERVWQQLKDQNVTHCFATPGWWRLLEPAFERHGALPRMRFATCSAEPFPASLAERMRGWLPNARIFNLYGATECCSNAGAYELPSGSEDAGPVDVTIPIGTPISGNRWRICDDDARDLTEGIGELCISGPCLALDYLEAEPGTSPFRLHAGHREFVTGDLASFDREGNVCLHGRKDNAIDYNGYSLQPETLEQVLQDIPGVLRAAVGSMQINERQQLTGIVELETAVPLSAVRLALKEEIPQHLMPRLRAATVPLNSAGKVDRVALHGLLASETDFLSGGVPSSSDALILELLEYLGADDTDRDADFFDLGGTSLTAIEVIDAAERLSGRPLDPEMVFADGKVSALAGRLWEVLRHASSATPEPKTHGEVQLNAMQRGMLLTAAGPRAAANVLRFAYRLPAAIDVAALQAAFLRAVGAHPVLTWRMSTNGRMTEPRQAPSRIWRTDDQRLGEGELDAFLSGIASEIDPLNGNNIQGGVVHVDNQRVFFFLVHHAVFDGWSRRVFLNTLSGAYQGKSPAEERSFLRHAHDIARWVTSDAAAEAGAHWRTSLEGAPLRSGLPLSGRTSDSCSSGDGHVFSKIPAQSLAQMRGVARATDTSLQSTLLSAFYLALAAHSEQRDLVIGVPFANRRSRSLHASVGCYVTLMPIRINATDTWSIEQLITDTHRRLLRGMSVANYPLERILKDLDWPRTPGTNPLVQTVFNVFDAGWGALVLDGQPTEELRPKQDASPNELCVFVRTSDSASEISLQFQTDRVDEPAIMALIRSFLSAAEAIVDRPQPVGELLSALVRQNHRARSASMQAGRKSRMASLKRRRVS